MGVNWNAGLMRWWPHVGKDGKAYPLNHLHPFRYELVMPAQGERPQTTVTVHVGFGMHCFTKAILPEHDEADRYGDDREKRTFCYDRYELSWRLGDIARELQQRPCAFAKDDNYVSIDVTTDSGERRRYALFFNVKRYPGKDRGENPVLLVVQSAYCLDPAKQEPGRGKIGFNVIVGHVLRNTRPKPPK